MDPPDIFKAVIYIHRPCPTRSGLAVGCFYVEIEGLSSRELFLISVLTFFNVTAFRRVQQREQITLEKQTFLSRCPHSGGTSVSSAGLFFE